MKLGTLFIFITFVLYLDAQNRTNDDIAFVVHRLVGDVGILKQVVGDQTKLIQKQDETIKAVESSVSLLTQVTTLLQSAMASINHKLDGQTSSMKALRKEVSDIHDRSLVEARKISDLQEQSLIEKNKVDKNEKDILIKTEQVKKIELKISEESKKVKSNEMKISEESKKVKDNEMKISKESKKVKDNEMKISEESKKVESSESKISDLAQKMLGVETKLSKEAKTVSDLGRKVSSEMTRSSSLEHRATNIEREMEKHFIGGAVLIGVKAFPNKYVAQEYVNSIPSVSDCLKWCHQKREKGGSQWNTCLYLPRIKQCINRMSADMSYGWHYPSDGWMTYHLL